MPGIGLNANERKDLCVGAASNDVAVRGIDNYGLNNTVGAKHERVLIAVLDQDCRSNVVTGTNLQVLDRYDCHAKWVERSSRKTVDRSKRSLRVVEMPYLEVDEVAVSRIELCSELSRPCCQPDRKRWLISPRIGEPTQWVTRLVFKAIEQVSEFFDGPHRHHGTRVPAALRSHEVKCRFC